MFIRRSVLPADDGAPFRGAVRSRAVFRSLIIACGLMLPLAAHAQPISGKGFLFGRPSGTLTLRGGLSRPAASSDVYSYVERLLTINHGDFTSGAVSADFDAWATNRLSVQVSAGYSYRTIGSEFRDWIDNDDRPIEQTTELRRAPMTLGVRYFITSPGRSLGRLAYVPSRIAPFAGAGVGAMWYSFKQNGDFVDVNTLDVFNAELKSSGWAPTAYAAAGFDVSVHPNVAISTEARYHVAHAAMSSDFDQFHKIDLSGLTASIGLSFRY